MSTIHYPCILTRDQHESCFSHSDIYSACSRNVPHRGYGSENTLNTIFLQ